jgi:hypothetical protein
MGTIVAYQKHIDTLTTKELNLPTDENNQRLGTELATVEGVTYVSLPIGVDLPETQPAEVAASINVVTLNPALTLAISNASPHVKLIRQQVAELIAQEYSFADEIKLLRTAPSAEFEAYNDYVEQCRQWGRDKKQAIGL